MTKNTANIVYLSFSVDFALKVIKLSEDTTVRLQVGLQDKLISEIKNCQTLQMLMYIYNNAVSIFSCLHTCILVKVMGYRR